MVAMAMALSSSQRLSDHISKSIRTRHDKGLPTHIACRTCTVFRPTLVGPSARLLHVQCGVSGLLGAELAVLREEGLVAQAQTMCTEPLKCWGEKSFSKFPYQRDDVFSSSL